jgi:hypothetical protein
MLVNDGGVVNLLSIETMKHVGIHPSKLIPIRTLLIGIKGCGLVIDGVMDLPITIGSHP